MRALGFILASLLLAAPLAAQRDKPEPLTEDQQDQIAEAGIYPVARIGLYIKFIDDYSDTVKGLTPRAHTAARVQRLNSRAPELLRPHGRARR